MLPDADDGDADALLEEASPEVEPGTLPPMSEWWAMLAIQPTSFSPAKAGAAMTMSGRWLPPPW